MASTNPYQPPSHRSTSSGQAAPGWKAMLFSTQGRISRSTFWIWTLVTIAATGVLMAVLLVPILMMESAAEAKGEAPVFGTSQYIALAVFIIGYIPVFWASIAIQVKRWHDRGKSGVWFFINFIPYIGGLWALIECGFLPGNPHSNQYGPDPLA